MLVFFFFLQFLDENPIVLQTCDLQMMLIFSEFFMLEVK
jgi:hypothetical protein